MRFDEINKRFQKYYQQNGHRLLPSSSLLHPSIPMSFVMSAGLVQIETSLNKLKSVEGTSYVLLQKCFRYFDVARVGYDDTRLSLFEMPGAFSFTSNGKSTTIHRMWEFVTKELNIAPHHLWVTFFAGDEAEGYPLSMDKDTYRTWKEIGIPEDRLIGLKAEDNYWIQGEGIDGLERYRKGGPNTEIFFDRGSQYSCSTQCQPGCKCGRFIEFANSLFVHRELDSHTGQMYPLTRPFIETVIGTERVAMILQRKSSVFEIDTIAPLLDILRRCYDSRQVNTPTPHISENIIVDHLRALIFLVADGAPPPGKGGRQRLIKKLVRQVLTHEILLNLNFADYLADFTQAVLSLYNISEPQQPVLPTLNQYLQNEVARFQKTIRAGQRQLNRYLAKNEGTTLTGKQIVNLEKQCGLSHELTAWQLRQRELPFCHSEYKTALAEWRKSL